MNSDMKIKRKLIMAAAVVTMLSANAFAQNPTGRVEVRKDYQADLTGAKKGMMKIDFSDTLRKFDLNMDYRIKDKQLRDLYAFSPMPSAGISSREKEQIPSFFAKAGISFPLAPTFALWYQPTLSVNSDMVTLKASHDSYHGKARIADINASDKVFATKFDTQAKEWKNTVGASYTHLWKNARLNADFNFRNGHNTYYGADLARNTIYDIAEYSELAKNKSFMKDNLSHDYNQVEVALSANSMDSEDYQGKFHYDGQLSFTSTADDSKFYANSFKLKENQERYKQLSTLQNRQNTMSQQLDSSRDYYAAASADNRQKLADDITNQERELLLLQQRIKSIEKTIRNTENIFLTKNK